VFKSRLVNGVPKLYTSEPANDLWIREIVFPNKKNGYFVEAGAADGFQDSSCYILERQLGWRGICIEPHDELFAKLVRTRPDSIHENVCLAHQSGYADYAFCSEAGDTSPFLSGVREVLADRKLRGADVIAGASIVRKQTAALAELLRKHQAPRQIEYGAFDIEGSEFEALRSFPFDEYRFLALSFEVDKSIRKPLFELLTRNGYRETSNPLNENCRWERYWLHESLGEVARIPPHLPAPTHAV
jgi:methyltransferase FkbM-like protein